MTLQDSIKQAMDDYYLHGEMTMPHETTSLNITIKDSIKMFREEMEDVLKDMTGEKREEIEASLTLAAEFTALALTTGNPDRYLRSAKIAMGIALDNVAMAKSQAAQRTQQAIVNVVTRLIASALAAV